METNHLQARRNIMRRVFFWYTLRRATSPLAKLGVFASTLTLLTASVSIRDVIVNGLGALESPLQFGRFALDAFATTEIAVQVAVLVGVVVVGMLFIDLYRNFNHTALRKASAL